VRRRGADHGARGSEAAGVAGEGTGRVAKDVARELVEDEDLGERALRVGGPRREFAAQRPLDQGPEALADRRVERRILAEPHRPRRAPFGIARRPEPEIEHVGSVHRRIVGAAATMTAP
jgi:hypothetical protein